jgi:hypothetical protein
MAKTMPLEELLSWVKVDVETGEIFWNYRPDKAPQWNGKYAGKHAGGMTSTGYWVVNIRCVHHSAHHIVWRVANGYWPSELDHIDGDRLNNRLSNLREVTRTENQRNRGVSPSHPTGVFGVTFNKKAQKWRAVIAGRSVRKHLGLFTSFEDAVAARRAAEVLCGYHPNHGQREATCGL